MLQRFIISFCSKLQVRNLTETKPWVETIFTNYLNTGKRLDALMDSVKSADAFFDKLRASSIENSNEDHIQYLENLISSNSSGRFSLWKTKDDPNKYVLWKEFAPHAWYDFEVRKILFIITPIPQ